jgi:polysaccharide deacetylase family protein (PEP-CTERM system associated)
MSIGLLGGIRCPPVPTLALGRRGRLVSAAGAGVPSPVEELLVSVSATVPWRREPAHVLEGAHGPPAAPPAPVILSFDVEEHFRIEAAAGLVLDPSLEDHYRERLVPPTHWLLEQLDRFAIKATFFIVGQIAQHNPGLVKTIARAGHEVASHSWSHRRVHHFTRESFRVDLLQSRDALEQVTGQPVLGYRAPTFSIVTQTAWALDVLAESGMLYDSSIYPVRHDRYGVPDAPRSPFLARGMHHAILELPPATLRSLGMNAPMGGGGYFRLFPLFLTRWAIRQMVRDTSPPVAMLYFHPWELDPNQARLPLGRVSRFRTYVGIKRCRQRLTALLARYPFARALDVARTLSAAKQALPEHDVARPGSREQSASRTKGAREAVAAIQPQST